jgi:hypothetical protein
MENEGVEGGESLNQLLKAMTHPAANLRPTAADAAQMYSSWVKEQRSLDRVTQVIERQ